MHFGFHSKNAILDVALHHVCLMCAILHSDLQVIHSDFQPFSTFHCSEYVSEYKSVLFLFNNALIHLINVSIIKVKRYFE